MKLIGYFCCILFLISKKMECIDKNLDPSLRLIDSFKRMKEIHVQGISFMKDRHVDFSKRSNKFTISFDTQITEHTNVESAKFSNLQEFTFLHNNRSYIVPKDMSIITKYKDNLLEDTTNNTFSVDIDIHAMYSAKIKIDRKYYFRYFVPVNKQIEYDDYDHYNFLCKGKSAGNLIKIARPNDEIHLYHFRYHKELYLVVESTKPCNFKDIEDIAYSTLLTLGFFSGTFHLQETYIVASKGKSFNCPVGLYYKSLRETISGQYSIFTTNAYSVLIPIARKMKAVNAEEKMMKKLDEKWKCRVERVKEDVFSKMMNLFYKHEPIARAALISLTASKLELGLQAGVYCIAFEAICNSVNKISNTKIPHVIEEKQWQDIKLALLEVLNNSSLSQDAMLFGKKKIDNLNEPTNMDKLSLPFNAVGYTLSKEEIKAIKDRNLFLHGHLNIGKNENEVDKLFYTSLMFHRLCCILILKLSGFKGYIVNNLALYASNMNMPVHECGFKKI